MRGGRGKGLKKTEMKGMKEGMSMKPKQSQKIERKKGPPTSHHPFPLTPLILSLPLMMIFVQKIEIFGNSVVFCTCMSPLKKHPT